MQTSKNIFSVVVAIFLLIVFAGKITRTVFSPLKFQKAVVVSSDQNFDDQEDEKKHGSKTEKDFDNELTASLSNHAEATFCRTICNLHHHYLIGFVDAHYPSVVAPPPDCALFFA